MSGAFPQPPAAGRSQMPNPDASIAMPPPKSMGGGADFAAAIENFEAVAAKSAPTVMSKKRQALAVGAAVVGGALAALVAAFVSVSKWVGPEEAAIWMGVAALVAGGTAAMLVLVSGRQDISVKMVIRVALPALLVAVGAGMLGGLWAAADVRMQAVGLVPEDAVVFDKILTDPDVDVAVAGCQRIIEHRETSKWRPMLMSKLTLRPEVASGCIESIPREDTDSLSPSLADRWTRELAGGAELDENRACAVAGAMSTLQLERAELDARLLYCALGSDNPAAQSCCGQVLAATVADGKQWVGNIRDTIGYIRDDRTALGVFALAFHQKNLTEAQRNFAKSVTFSGPDAQRVALEFGCDSVIGGKMAIIDHFDATLEGSCAVNSGALPRARATWTDICGTILIELDSNPKSKPTDVLCDTTRDVLVGQAVDAAQSLVRIARQKDTDSRLAGSINSGYSRLVNDISKEGASRDENSWVDASDVNAARMASSEENIRLIQQGKSAMDLRKDRPFMWNGKGVVPNPDYKANKKAKQGDQQAPK